MIQDGKLFLELNKLEEAEAKLNEAKNGPKGVLLVLLVDFEPEKCQRKFTSVSCF